jgi:hypothetical protein
MSVPRAMAALLAASALTGCGDLLSPADRVPTGVAFEEAVVTVTEGDAVDLRPYVVDQDGRRFDRLPVWAGFDWRTSDPAVFQPSSGFTALAPGQATATVRIADLEGFATVRVNPVSLGAAIPHAYLVQSVQRLDGTVPMVADRKATLRIFATGDIINFFQPEVEAVFHVDGQEVGRRRVGLTRGGSLPRAVDEGEFASSWAVDVPAAWVRPGLAFSVRLDPDGALPLTNPAPVRFPAEGMHPVDVRVVPDLDLRLVPIHQNRFGTVGDVTTSTAHLWTEFLEEVFPVAGITRNVRAPFYTDLATPGNQTDWDRLLPEIWVLRYLDDDDRFYYGVLRRHGGYAGLGYVGYPAAIGWDEFGHPVNDPTPLAYTTFAHELGHNFGRWHAPACSPGSGLDPSFPYPGGVAGVFGLDHARGQITPATIPDLMGYCNPHWISDYTYEGVLEYRLGLEAERRRFGFEAQAGPGLLVWGSVTDGQVSLEPAIAVEHARPHPAGGNDLVVEGHDAAGRVLFRQPATSMAFSHGPTGRRSFSTVVPLGAADLEAVHHLRVTGPGVAEGSRRGRLVTTPAEARDLAAGRARAFSATRGRAGATDVVWDADRFPLLVVREAASGAVVAFARQGRLELPDAADRLTFDLSDGVRTVRARPERR